MEQRMYIASIEVRLLKFRGQKRKENILGEKSGRNLRADWYYQESCYRTAVNQKEKLSGLVFIQEKK